MKQIIPLFALLLTSFCLVNAQSFSVHFASDKAHLNQTAKSRIKSELQSLKYPFSCYQVSIAGHTDHDGDDAYNVRLSERRVATVRSFLMDYGIDPELIETDRFGEHSPIADNGSEEGKQKNRRTVIEFIPTGKCKAPSLGENMPFQTTKFKAEDGIEFVSDQSGSLITIEPGSLIDKNGHPVTGEAELHFREWRTPEEILLSGISMAYPSPESPEFFHSTGMFQIECSQNGKKLSLAKDKPVRIDYNRTEDLADADLFEYDAKRKTWRRPGEPWPWKAKKEEGKYFYNRDVDIVDVVYVYEADTCDIKLNLNCSKQEFIQFRTTCKRGALYARYMNEDFELPDWARASLEERWTSNEYAGSSYIPVMKNENLDSLKGVYLSKAKSPVLGEKGFVLQDSHKVHKELATLWSGVLIPVDKTNKEIMEASFEKAYFDVRIQPMADSSTWKVMLKDEQGITEIEVLPKYNKFVLNPSIRKRYAKISFKDYSKRLERREKRFDEYVNGGLDECFWQYARLIFQPKFGRYKKCMDESALRSYMQESPEHWASMYDEYSGISYSGFRRLVSKFKGNKVRRVITNSYTTYDYVPKEDLDENGNLTAEGKARLKASRGLTKTLFVASFGVWNTDQIRKVENPVPVMATFYSKGKKEIIPYKVMVLNPEVNGYLSFFGNYFEFFQSQPCKLLVLGKDGKSYLYNDILDPDRVKHAKGNFNLHELPSPLNPQQLNRILEAV